VTNPAFTNWDFKDSFEVTVSKAAFGTAGFGKVTIGEVHNSPSKLTTNAIIPTPCP
jgi:hypothetical protein